jgi:protein tyrosine phosphatase (PTP) superfamily phosphohydrolase (DUF442 family)
MASNELYNYIEVSERLITSGQPTRAQFEALASEGFTTVVNLATGHSSNALEDEAGIVQSLGLAYHHIPVEWESPQESDFAAFEEVMAQLPPGKALLHCAANFRVTAFYSLYAQKHLGWSEAQAHAFRTQIWADSHYPVWQAFIERMEAQIAAAAAASSQATEGGV